MEHDDMRAFGGATPSNQLHVLILSGSGADGAYQVGVLKALFEGRSPATKQLPIEPSVVAATSTGAFNSCFLLSQWDDIGVSALRNLEKVWLDRLSWNWFVNGSFRVRLNPLELLDPRTYTLRTGFVFPLLLGDLWDLSSAGWERAKRLLTSRQEILPWIIDNFDLSLLVGTEPWKETIADSIDFKKVLSSNLRLTIATTNWKTGEVRCFVNRHGRDAICREVVRAASALPGIHGPEIVNGEMHVDAESQLVTPLLPALKQLREIAVSEPGKYEFHLHVIHMRAQKDEIPVTSLESMLRTLYRSQVINWTSRIDQDLQRVWRTNQGMVMIEDLAALDSYEASGSQGLQPEAIATIRKRVASMPMRERKGLLTAATRIMERIQARGEWIKLTVHRYYPSQGLDSALGVLDFRRSRLKRLIEHGFSDTVGHDCRANRCVKIEPTRRGGNMPLAIKASGLPHPARHALVFSGGGAFGAYQVGVAKALLGENATSTSVNQPLKPEVFAGTSIGAFNASFLVSKWSDDGSEAIAGLENVWLERIPWRGGANGAFRIRLNPLELLSFGGPRREGVPERSFRNWNSDIRYLFEQVEKRGLDLFMPGEPFLDRLGKWLDLSILVAHEPWEETIKELIDIRMIRESSRCLTIAVTNWTRGIVEHFGNRNVSPEAIRASTAVPGFYPPAIVDGETCLDGAVLMNTPLEPAIGELRRIASEAEESEFILHVVYLSEEAAKSSISQGILQTLFRSQAIHWGSTVEQDIEWARKLNQGLSQFIDMLIALGKEGGTELRDEEIRAIHESVDTRPADEGRALFETSEKIMQRREAGRPYKQLTIHRYFPRKSLGGALELVDVRRSTLEKLINEGFHDTIEHDCTASNCVLVGGGPRS